MADSRGRGRHAVLKLVVSADVACGHPAAVDLDDDGIAILRATDPRAGNVADLLRTLHIDLFTAAHRHPGRVIFLSNIGNAATGR
ncbi:hypothetical protein ACNUDN_05521 [Mycobacterium sp. smrl_JER01]